MLPHPFPGTCPRCQAGRCEPGRRRGYEGRETRSGEARSAAPSPVRQVGWFASSWTISRWASARRAAAGEGPASRSMARSEQGRTKTVRTLECYHVRDIEHGPQVVAPRRDGTRSADADIGGQDVVVLAGPLVAPSAEASARQVAHLAARPVTEWARSGRDAHRDGRRPRSFTWTHSARPAVPDGALFKDRTWSGPEWDADWVMRACKPGPKVLNGLLVASAATALQR